MSRLVLHAFIHFLRSENLLVVGKGPAHPLAYRILIFALKRSKSARNDSIRSSIWSTALPPASDNCSSAAECGDSASHGLHA